MTIADAQPYDAVLLLSFGGPEQPDDVIPFLENVTRGRGIPRERLSSVAEHYLQLGGRSPINDRNRALLAGLRAELDRRGLTGLPMHWGNRNWAPYLVDTLRDTYRDGARRLAVLVTSAYSSYSGCRQYREDLADALSALAAQGCVLEVDKIRNYYNHPGFVAPVVAAVLAGIADLPAGARDGARIVFVTHSVPLAMNEASGPTGGGYLAQHQDISREVAAGVAEALGRRPAWDLVFCSRSGPPGQPWLEPDVNDHLRALHDAGVSGVVVVPVGFVSDHMEVVYDLDIEARQTADELGVPFVRVPTVGVDPRFVAALVDLILERAAAERGEHPVRPSVGPSGPSHDVCPAGCCRNPRADRPAACGQDQVPAVAAVAAVAAPAAPAAVAAPAAPAAVAAVDAPVAE